MKRVFNLLAGLVIVSLLSFAGYRLGWVIAIAWEEGAFVRWVAVPLPDSQHAVHFVVDETDANWTATIHVETEQGTFFIKHLDTNGDHDAWTQAEQPEIERQPSDSSDGCTHRVTLYYKQMRNPPGTVVEQADCNALIWPDGGGCLYRLVILDNGSVWLWENREGPWDGLITVYLTIAVCTVAGLVVGIILVGFWRKALRQPRSAQNSGLYRNQ
jgi:hypothetical protein